MSDLTIEFTDRLVVMTCWCGVNHAVPQDLRDFQRRQFHDGRDVTSIYCPLGHQHQPAGKTKAERERERAEQAENCMVRERAAREQAQASERAQRAAATRARNERNKDRTRVANGVCPCCNRTFKQLARHMKSKHPEFVKEPTK